MRLRYAIPVAAALIALCTASAVAVSMTHGADARAATDPIAAADPEDQQAYFADEMAKTIGQISLELDDPGGGWAGTTHRTTVLTGQGAKKSYADKTKVYGMGDPRTVYTVERSSVPGATVDLYHPGGWHDDLLLLGAAYRSLAPTRWVELTSAYKPPADPGSAFPSSADPCAYPGPHQQLCWIKSALDAAARTTHADQRHYRLRRNASEHSLVLETDVQVRNAVPTGLIVLPRAAAGALSRKILDGYLRISISVHDDGTQRAVKQIRVWGTASAAGVTLTVDDGYDWDAVTEGQAGFSDFPAVPLLFDVTRLKTADQRQHFGEQFRKLHAQTMGS